MRTLILGTLMGCAAVVIAEGGQSGPPPRTAATKAGAYAISYLEVRRSAEHAAIDALHAYREASRKEPGWIATEILAQIGRPGHFATIERWADQQALESHDRGDPARRLADRLEPIRTSEYDRRPYTPLAVAAPLAQAGNDAVVVVSHVDTLPSPQSDAAGLLTSLAERSRTDAGNLLFNVLEHAARANHFTVIEIWRDRAAQQSHAEAPHVREYRDTLKAISGSPLDERLFSRIR